MRRRAIQACHIGAGQCGLRQHQSVWAGLNIAVLIGSGGVVLPRQTHQNGVGVSTGGAQGDGKEAILLAGCVRHVAHGNQRPTQERQDRQAK